MGQPTPSGSSSGCLGDSDSIEIYCQGFCPDTAGCVIYKLWRALIAHWTVSISFRLALQQALSLLLSRTVENTSNGGPLPLTRGKHTLNERESHLSTKERRQCSWTREPRSPHFYRESTKLHHLPNKTHESLPSECTAKALEVKGALCSRQHEENV